MMDKGELYDIDIKETTYTLFLSTEEVYRLPQDIDYPKPKSKSKVTGSEDVEF